MLSLHLELIMKYILLSTLILFTFAGCERTRSFMQMDSNSGSPFMGLQLSVDAKQRVGNDLIVAADSMATDSSTRSPLSVPFKSVSGRNAKLDFVETASSKLDEGNLKFSLPKVDLSNSPDAAAEVEDILTRI